MAACSVGAATVRARHWVHERALTGGFGECAPGLSQRLEGRRRPRRRGEREGRVPVGARQIWIIAGVGQRIRRAPREPPNSISQRFSQTFIVTARVGQPIQWNAKFAETGRVIRRADRFIHRLWRPWALARTPA